MDDSSDIEDKKSVSQLIEDWLEDEVAIAIERDWRPFTPI